MMDRGFLAIHGIEQLDKETDKAFRAFRCYVAMEPAQRSLRALEAQGESAWSSLCTWSRTHKWQERAAQLDKRMTDEAFRRLLQNRRALVVRALEASLEDAARFRTEIMGKLAKRCEAEQVATLLNARIDCDDWLHSITDLLAQLGGLEI